jgi:serine/threonine protein kinase
MEVHAQHNPQEGTLGERLSINNRRALDYAVRFRKEKLVGAGTYGKVYRALDVSDDPPRLVALKEIRLDAEDQGIPSTALREISLLRELDHPNVIKCASLLLFRCASCCHHLLYDYEAPHRLQITRYHTLRGEKSNRDSAADSRF